MNLYVLLITICFTFGKCSSFQHMPRFEYTTRFKKFLPYRLESSKVLINFGWFGGKGENQSQQKIDENSNISKDGKNSLGGVAGVMDSMERYKKAQRIGKMTASVVQDLVSTTVEGLGDNGKVKVVFDCQQRAVRTIFEEGYFESLTSAQIESSVTSAMKDAHSKSEALIEQITRNFYAELGNGILELNIADSRAGETENKTGRNKSKIDRLKSSLKQDLAGTTVEGTAENGKIKVVYNCRQQPISISIDEGYLESAFLLDDVCDAVTLAMQDAYVKSTERMDEKMKSLYFELGLSSN